MFIERNKNVSISLLKDFNKITSKHQKPMNIEIKGNIIEVHFPNKVVKIRGSQDEDGFRVFTEKLEGNPRLSDEDIEAIKEKLSLFPDIVID